MPFRTNSGIPHTFSYKNSDAVMKVRCISWLWLVSYNSLAIRFMDRYENAATQKSFKLLTTRPGCGLVFRGLVFRGLAPEPHSNSHSLLRNPNRRSRHV